MRLFEQRPAVLAHYQERWRYLLVDEYQDTNRAQYLWIRLLAGERTATWPWSATTTRASTRWRGADLRNILDFERDYPDATVVKLEQNYRSTQLILDAAHAVVSRNEARKDKKLWTENPRGVQIERFEADRRTRRREWVARQVEALVGGRGAGGSFLARRADEGDERQLPPAATSRSCTAPTPRAARSRRRSCATACATSWSAARASTSGARSRTRSPTCACCAATPTRPPSSGSSTCRRAASARRRSRPFAREAAGARRQRLGGAARRAAAVRDRRLATRTRTRASPASCHLRGCAAGSACSTCPSCSTWCSRRPATGRCCSTARRRARTAGPTCSSCARSSTRYGDLEPEDALDRLLEETALVADQDAYEEDADAVTLITLHAAKGLEFDVVFITGLEEGVFPHSRALDDQRQMEEERRLAYVGLTRARHRLYLTHAAHPRDVGQGRLLGPVALPAGDSARPDARAPTGRAGSVRATDDDQRPDEERAGQGYDLSYILGPRAASRLVGRRASVDEPRGSSSISTRGGRASAAGRRLHAACRRAARGRDVRAVARPEREARRVLRKPARSGLPNAEPVKSRAGTPAKAASGRSFPANAASATATASAIQRSARHGRDLEADARRRGSHGRVPRAGVKKLLASLANLEILEP